MAGLVRNAVDACLSDEARRRWRLRFPGEIERRYQEHRFQLRVRESVIVGLLSTVLFDLFLFCDYAMDPRTIGRAMLLRLAVFTPCSLVSIAMGFSWRLRHLREPSGVLATATASACMLAIYFGQGAVVMAIGVGGVLVVMVHGALVFRPNLACTAALNLVLVVQTAVFLYLQSGFTRGEQWLCLSLVSTLGLLSLVSNYRTEGLERRAYLLFLREDLRGRSIARRNRDLAQLSQRDELTGLSNRRHFDQRLRRAWADAAAEGTPVSLVMADIDFFKRLNDTYGHLQGDRVLVDVAETLRSSVREGEDLVARFGGEEFLILLPNTGNWEAMETADRCCARVRGMNIRYLKSGHAVNVAISCGVATALPAQAGDPLELIAHADQALYTAKRGGRDRACSLQVS